MKSLRDRWKTLEGEKLRFDIISALKENKGFDTIPNLTKFNNKYDLRGIVFPYSIGETTKTGKLSLTNVERTQFYNTKIINADLSYCDLTLTEFIDCSLENIYAIKGKFVSCRFLGTNVSNSIFDECNFEESGMGKYRKESNNPCKFENLYFIKCNLKNTLYLVAEYRKVTFDNCKIKDVDFDGTRFFDCVFKGELDSVMFYGNSRILMPTKNESPVDRFTFFNSMQNVDFTEAKLLGIGFRQRCDISTCKFPQNDNYLFVYNSQLNLELIKQKLSNAFEGKEREWALRSIEDIKMWFDREGTKIYLLDKYITLQYFGLEYTTKYFNILQEVIALPDAIDNYNIS